MPNSFGVIAAHLSRYAPLGSGDMVLSGTPAGTAMQGGLHSAFLRDGDDVAVEVDSMAPLHNQIALQDAKAGS